MNRNFLVIILLFTLLIIFINAFSSSYISHNIVNLAYVIALGIDVGENSNIRTTAQFVKYSSSSSGSDSSGSGDTTLISAESDSIFSALNILNSYIGKEINLSHCSVLVFSEEFARKGISTEIYSLINDEEFRPSTNLVISKCEAYEYLSNINPNIEKLATKYYDTFSITNRFIGYISNITIGEFYNNLASTTCDGTAILGGINSTNEKENSSSTSSSKSSSDSSNSSDKSSEGSSENSSSNKSTPQEDNKQSSNTDSKKIVTNPEELIAGNSSIVGKRASENIGLAVFDGDKFCGELTAMESLCHLLIVNDVDSCTISINNPLVENKKIELNLFCIEDSKISVEIKDNIPIVSIHLKADADVLTLDDNIDYQSPDNIEKISNAAKKYLDKEMKDYLNKISKEYGTDIDNFGIKAVSKFATISEWENYNWLENFKTAEFNVNIEINVASSLLVTNN